MSLVLLATALAQSPAPAVPLAQAAPRVVVPEVTEIEFDARRVNGEWVGPNGEAWFARPKPEFTPLIVLRVDFDAEMAHSVRFVR